MIEIIPAAKEKGMGIIIGSPLQQGALARRYDHEVDNGAPWLSLPRREQLKMLYRFLDEIHMDIAEAGIRFVISNPDVSCVLMGASNPRHVELNVAFTEKGPFPADILRTRSDCRACPFPTVRRALQPWMVSRKSRTLQGPYCRAVEGLRSDSFAP